MPPVTDITNPHIRYPGESRESMQAENSKGVPGTARPVTDNPNIPLPPRVTIGFSGESGGSAVRRFRFIEAPFCTGSSRPQQSIPVTTIDHTGIDEGTRHAGTWSRTGPQGSAGKARTGYRDGNPLPGPWFLTTSRWLWQA